MVVRVYETKPDKLKVCLESNNIAEPQRIMYQVKSKVKPIRKNVSIKLFYFYYFFMMSCKTNNVFSNTNETVQPSKTTVDFIEM